MRSIDTGARAAPALADFAGGWAVQRRIRDRLAGQTGTFAGRAFFAEEGASLTYREAGELRLGPGPPMLAERAYRWRSEGALIVVDHADGRPFHSFDPADPRTTHLCAPDIYGVRYDFSAWPHWRSVWSVTGPRKDYVLTTDYTPATPTDSALDPEP